MEIQFIVDKLNEAPFNQDLSLVTFDEKSPFELLQLLNRILTEITAEPEIDLRDEAPELTADRFMEHLRVLGFRHTGSIDEFRQGLVQGDRVVVYSIMGWALGGLQNLKRRSYLAKYLVNIEVPEEFFADEAMVEVYQQYKELQTTFKETHKAVDKMRGQTMQPGELRKEIAQLEMEKEQLNTKINKLKTKLENLPNFQELYEVVSKLRTEQEEEDRLSVRMQEQEQQLRQSEQRIQTAHKRLKDTQAASRDESANALLQRLEDDTDVTRVLVEEKLPQDIAQKQTRIHHIQLVLDHPPVSDHKLADIQTEIKLLQNDISALVDKQERMTNPDDDKLTMFRQQASVVARKKQDFMDKLQMLNEEKQELEGELNEKQDASSAKGGTKVLKGDEFKKFAADLRNKQMQYKKMTGALGEIKAEYGILKRTEDILKSRDVNLREYMDSLEKKKGVEGYQSTQDRLESVSATSAAVNEEKAKSLEEISRLASEIIAQIKDKKSKLAPQIKELRAVRTKYNELEAVWLEKKQAYENTSVGLETERSKLEQQLTAYQDEVQREESRYHYVQGLSLILEAQRSRVENEGRARLSEGQAEFRSYRELYQSKIQSQENLSKTLREKQKIAKESHEPNLRQMAMFKDLKKLMHVKLASVRNQRLEMSGAEVGARAAPNGADMFVMDG
mmetsp:Transcript_22453/g.52360  ORF Transcript_22453/g.52360 Transcript_22453/m.52360 type:complete len:676 (+) Transcript_22453:87-2114(+)|eukprot:CAMPEP_0114555688 /NCGR_PEP_ID=MMETSP0114-20121206/8886_1 /TAXON_ID=31324 /ORGANISM="Goniomonas sp, Strain m" /LENGTH=675 /DNA_ID=CAMNT_0001740837 /DNA_START=95 /DNA_END=2122 /DNA_ORIENTATION=+